MKCARRSVPVEAQTRRKAWSRGPTTLGCVTTALFPEPCRRPSTTCPWESAPYRASSRGRVGARARSGGGGRAPAGRAAGGRQVAALCAVRRGRRRARPGGRRARLGGRRVRAGGRRPCPASGGGPPAGSTLRPTARAAAGARARPGGRRAHPDALAQASQDHPVFAFSSCFSQGAPVALGRCIVLLHPPDVPLPFRRVNYRFFRFKRTEGADGPWAPLVKA